MRKRAKQLSDADLIAVMSLRVHEKTLAGAAAAAADSSAVAAEDSDVSEETSASTRGAASVSGSPMLQPKKRSRSS